MIEKRRYGQREADLLLEPLTCASLSSLTYAFLSCLYLSTMFRFRPMMAALLLCGCTTEPVLWNAVVTTGAPLQPSEFPGRVRPPSMGGCGASLRVAESEGSAFAAWWRP